MILFAVMQLNLSVKTMQIRKLIWYEINSEISAES